jgi:hypothetical protein
MSSFSGGSSTRRETVMGGLLSFIWTCAGGCSCLANVNSSRELGCYVPAEEAPEFFSRTTTAQVFQFGTEDIEPRSGNPALDRALAQTLGRLARSFDVLPAFAYYRDGNRPNALATPERLLQRADGTVLFGLSMLQMLLARPEHPDASIVAVCAHEFGHIISYKAGFIDRLAPDRRNPFRAEQYADYIAGFFAGLRTLERPDFPAVVFATTQRSFGGTIRGTHGTGEERASAVVEGYKAAYERRASPAEGIQRAFEFAMSRQ